MFEIKYDKDGYPIPGRPPVEEVVSQPEVPVEAQSESNHEISEPEFENAQESETEGSSEFEPAVDEPQNTYLEEPVQETNKERNLRILRELKEEAERQRIKSDRERDEAVRRARELEEYYKINPQQNQDDSDDIGIDDDELAEIKHVKKVSKQVNDLKKQLEYYKKQAEQQSFEQRIKSEFPDFEKVVTPDNIALLKHLKPRQAALLNSSSDAYATAANAYEMIKEYGIYQSEDVMNKKLVAKNMAKPKPSASIGAQKGDSPLRHANAFATRDEFSPELAKRLAKEMRDAARNY